jgi:flagellar biosynthesis/type III secretory pathway M-ring protein FliF/YscJ
MEGKNEISSAGITLDFIGNAAVGNTDLKLSNQPLNNNEELMPGSQSNTEKNSIKAIIKHSGEITGYELSNGERITKEEGVELAKAGAISGVSVSTSRKGEEYLRSLRDDDESNNLNSLPIIKE